MKTTLLIVTLGGMLIAATVAAVILSLDIGSIRISLTGILALVFGGLLTIALAAGLMALVFFSARRGYDDIDR